MVKGELLGSRPVFPPEGFSCMVAVVAPSCQHRFHEGSPFRLVADTLHDQMGSLGLNPEEAAS
jgi:hypothetical protein